MFKPHPDPVSYPLMTVTQSFDSSQWLTLLVLQDHYAVSVSVAIEMPWDDVTVVTKDLHKSLIVGFSDGGGVPGKGQVTHWNMSNYNDLQRDDRRNSMLRHQKRKILLLKRYNQSSMLFAVYYPVFRIRELRINAGLFRSHPHLDRQRDIPSTE